MSELKPCPFCGGNARHKELARVLQDAEIEVRKEAMERLANRTKSIIHPIVDKQN